MASSSYNCRFAQGAELTMWVMTVFRCGALGLLVLTLAACGNKGDLIRPESDQETGQETGQETDQQTRQNKSAKAAADAALSAPAPTARNP